MDNKMLKKRIFAVLGIVVLILFCFVLPVPEIFETGGASVEVSGRVCLGALGVILFTVLWWIGEVVPTYVTAMIEISLLVMFKYVNMATAFNAYTGSTLWMMFGGLCLALACDKTGFLKRVAFFLMKIFPASYRGQIAALLIIGTILQPLIPSTAPKCIIGIMMAMSVADNMGYDKLSKGRTGLFVAAWVGFGLTAPAFITSSNTIANANAAAENAGTVWTVAEWTVNSIPWLLIMVVGGFFLIPILYPADKSKLTKEFMNEQYKALGSMDKNEIVTAVAMLFAVIGWFSSFTNASIVGLFAAAILFVGGALDAKTDLNKVDWKLLTYVGGVLCMSSTFSKTGLNKVLSTALTPVIEALPNRFALFAICFIMIIGVRFVLLSQSFCASFFSMTLAPLFVAMGMHPSIAAFFVCATQQVFILSFQMTAYVPLLGVTNGGVEHGPVVKYAFAYQALSIIGIVLCCFLWMGRGFM